MPHRYENLNNWPEITKRDLIELITHYCEIKKFKSTSKIKSILKLILKWMQSDTFAQYALEQIIKIEDFLINISDAEKKELSEYISTNEKRHTINQSNSYKILMLWKQGRIFNGNQLSKLPNEIWLNIFTFLCIKDLKNLKSASYFYNALINLNWQMLTKICLENKENIDYNYFDQFEYHENGENNFQHLVALDPTKIAVACLKKVLIFKVNYLHPTNTPQFQLIKELCTHKEEICGLIKVSPNLLISADSNKIQIWDFKTYQSIKILKAWSSLKFQNLYSATDEFFYAQVPHQTLKRWDLKTYDIEPLSFYPFFSIGLGIGFVSEIKKRVYYKDFFITKDEQGFIHFWNNNTGFHMEQLRNQSEKLFKDFIILNTELILLTMKNEIKFFDLRAMRFEEQKLFFENNEWDEFLSIIDKNILMLKSIKVNSISIIDLKTEKIISTIKEMQESSGSVVLANDCVVLQKKKSLTGLRFFSAKPTTESNVSNAHCSPKVKLHH